MKELKEICGGDKLLSVQLLKERKSELTVIKQQQYEDYKMLRVQWRELSKLAKNRDSIFRQDMRNSPRNKKLIM